MEVAEKYPEFLHICNFINAFSDYLLQLNFREPIPSLYGLKLFFEGLEDDFKGEPTDEEFWRFICGLLVNYHKNIRSLGRRTITSLKQSARQRKTWLVEFCKNEDLEDELTFFQEDKFDEMPLKMKLHFLSRLLEAQIDVDVKTVEDFMEKNSSTSLRTKPFGKDNRSNVYYMFENAYVNGSSMLLKEVLHPDEKSLCILFRSRRKNMELEKLIKQLDEKYESGHCNNNEKCIYDENKDFVRKCAFCDLEWHSCCLVDPFLHEDEEESDWLCPNCNQEDLIVALKRI